MLFTIILEKSMNSNNLQGTEKIIIYISCRIRCRWLNKNSNKYKVYRGVDRDSQI